MGGLFGGTQKVKRIVGGLAFPEGPRWRRGVLYFSDMHSHQVLSWSQDHGLRVLAHIPGKPSGLGFLDDETLLVASQVDRSIYRLDLRTPNVLPVLHADVSAVAAWHVNDMLTDSQGRAYVGNYGSDAPPGEALRPADLALVETDGSVRVVARDLHFPNGMVLRKGGEELVVAETRSEPGRLTVFDVSDDGSLSNRRVLIEFETEWPDGIAIDSEDGIWVASPFSNEVIRVDVDGKVADRVAVDNPYAVALGGANGRELFVCTAETWEPEKAAADRTGAIDVVQADIPVADTADDAMRVHL